MAKQLHEIKDFASGLLTNADAKDLPDGASKYTYNISPNSGYGVAEAIFDNRVIMDLVPPITNMVVRPGLTLQAPSDLAVNIDQYLIDIPGYRSDTGLAEFYRILDRGELIANGKFVDEDGSPLTEMPSNFHVSGYDDDGINFTTAIVSEQNPSGSAPDPEAQSSNYYLRLKNDAPTNTNSKFRLWHKLETQPGFQYKLKFILNSMLAWTGTPGSSDRNPIGGRVYIMEAKYDDAGASSPETSEDHYPQVAEDARIIKEYELNALSGFSINIFFIAKTEQTYLCFDFDAEMLNNDGDAFGTSYGAGLAGGHQAFLSNFTCKLHLGTYMFKELGENLDMSDSDRGLFVSGEGVTPHIMHRAYDSDGDVSKYIEESECTPYLSRYSISNIDQMLCVPTLTGTIDGNYRPGVDTIMSVYGVDALYRLVYDDINVGEKSHETMIIETLRGELAGKPIGGMCHANFSSRSVPDSKYNNYTTYAGGTSPGALTLNASGADQNLYNRLFVFDYQGHKIHKIYFESTNSSQYPDLKVEYTISINAGEVSGYINGISHSYGQDEDGYHYIYFSVYKSGGLTSKDTAIYAVRDKQGMQKAFKLYTIPEYMHLTAYTGFNIRRNWIGMRRDVNPTGSTDFYWPKGGSYVPVSYKNGSNKDEDHMTKYGYTDDVCWIHEDGNKVKINIPHNSISTMKYLYDYRGSDSGVESSYKEWKKPDGSGGLEVADVIVCPAEPKGKTRFMQYSGVCHKIIQNPYWIPDSWGSADGWWTHIDEHQNIQDDEQLIVINPWDESTRGMWEFELDLRPARSDDLNFNMQKAFEALNYFRTHDLPNFPDEPSPTGGTNHVDHDFNSGQTTDDNDPCDHYTYSPNYPVSVYNKLKTAFNAVKSKAHSGDANTLIDQLLAGVADNVSISKANSIISGGKFSDITSYWNYGNSSNRYDNPSEFWGSFEIWYNHVNRFISAKSAIDSDQSEKTIAGFDKGHIRHLNIGSDEFPSSNRHPNHLYTFITDSSISNLEATAPGDEDYVEDDWVGNEYGSMIHAWQEFDGGLSDGAPSSSMNFKPNKEYIAMEEVKDGKFSINISRLRSKKDTKVNFGGNSGLTTMREAMYNIQHVTSHGYNYFDGYTDSEPESIVLKVRQDYRIAHTSTDDHGFSWPTGDQINIFEGTSCFAPPGFTTNAGDYLEAPNNISTGEYTPNGNTNWKGMGLFCSTYTGSLRLDKLAFNKAQSKSQLRGTSGNLSDYQATWPEGISPGIIVTPGTQNSGDPEDAGLIYLEDGDIVLYNISLLYDGYQEGPLLNTPVTYEYDQEVEFGQGASVKLNSVDIRVSLSSTNPRVTHVQLYKKKDVLDEWRLVGSKPFDTDWTDTGVADMYKMQSTTNFVFNDSVDVQGISYQSLTGIPETLDKTIVDYEESAVAGSYMFVCRADIEGMSDAHKLIFRSEVSKYSIFNWPQNYVGIDEVPITMLGVQNRLYVWSEKAMYIIDPFNLIIEDRIPGKGVFNRDAVLNYNNLVVFANETGVYAFEGKVIDLSLPIKDEYTKLIKSIGNKYKIKLAHNPKHDSIMLMFDNAGTESVDIVPTDVFVYTAKTKRWDRWKFPGKIKSVTTSEVNTCLISAESPSVASYNSQGEALNEDGEVMDSYKYALYEVQEGDKRLPIEFRTKKLTMGFDSRLKKFKKIKLTAPDCYICRVEIDGRFREYTEEDSEYSNSYVQTLNLRVDGVYTGTPSTEFGLEETGDPLVDEETGEDIVENPNDYFSTTGMYMCIHIKSKAPTTDSDEEGNITILNPDSSLESIGIIYSLKSIK